MKSFLMFTLLVVVFTRSAKGVQIETSGAKPFCEELSVMSPLRVYRDPALFLSNLKLIYSDPDMAWEEMKEESPLLTSLERGTAHFMRLGPPQPFKNYKGIARVYEAADPRLKLAHTGNQQIAPLIVPIKICGNGSYNDTLGFVFLSDLELAKVNPLDPNALPPSTKTIPKYPLQGNLVDSR